MSFQPGAVVNTQGFGSKPENVEVPWIDSRAPTVMDNQFPVGKVWLDKTEEDSYQLMNFSWNSGTSHLDATWVALGGQTVSTGEVVTDSGTVTPVNRTISLLGSSPITTSGSGSTATINLGIVPVAKGGTALSSVPTSGQLLIGNGTGYSLSTLTAGSGVTITNGSGSISIASTASTGFVLIENKNQTNVSSIVFSTGISSSYTKYMFIISNMSVGTDTSNVELTISNDGGATYASSNYRSGVTYSAINATTWSNQFTGSVFNICYNLSSLTSSGCATGQIIFGNGTNATNCTINGQMSYQNAGTDMVFANIQGYQTGTTGINAFRFKASAGNITANISLYGIA